MKQMVRVEFENDRWILLDFYLNTMMDEDSADRLFKSRQARSLKKVRKFDFLFNNLKCSRWVDLMAMVILLSIFVKRAMISRIIRMLN